MEDAIVTVVNSVWGKYDVDGSGQLDREEAMAFVKDSLTQMGGGKQTIEFSKADFDQFFKELDADGSGTVDKEEMFRFVRIVCGCPTKADLEATKKRPTPRGPTKAEDEAAQARLAEERARLLAAQKKEMDAICPLSKEMQNLAQFLHDQRPRKDKSGNSLMQHVKKTFQLLVRHYPTQALEKFEEVSYLVKHANDIDLEKFLRLSDTHNYKEVAKSLSEQVSRITALYSKPKGDEEEEQAVFDEPAPIGFVQDLLADKKVFQWGGVGFGEQESYCLQKSIKKLVGDHSLSQARLFGKIKGTKSDYYVVEVPNEGEPDPDLEAAPDTEPMGAGVNKNCYWVTSNAFSTWTKLPECSPQHINEARQIKVLVTGDLEAAIITNPTFEGQEKHYIRAQIARIVQSTTLLPAGQWKISEETDREIVEEEPPEEGELLAPNTCEMTNLDMWCHANPNILLNCRTLHAEPEDNPDDPDQDFDPELAAKMIEAADPYEPRLKTISADKKINISEKIYQPSWTVRIMGDSEEYKHDETEGSQNTKTKSFGVVVVRSLIWPGAYSFYYQGQVKQVYVGSLHKWEFAKKFFPIETPMICSDPQEFGDFPEPFPLEEPVVEQEAVEGEEGQNSQEEEQEY